MLPAQEGGQHYHLQGAVHARRPQLEARPRRLYRGDGHGGQWQVELTAGGLCSVYYGLSLLLILSYQLNFNLKAQALLGELEPAGGEALLWRPRRGVGYIAQEAWLQVHG